MRFDLPLYDQFPDDDYRKTYDLLMSFIVNASNWIGKRRILRRKRRRGVRSPILLSLLRRLLKQKRKRQRKKRKSRRKRRKTKIRKGRKRRRKKGRRKKRKRKSARRRRRRRRRTPSRGCWLSLRPRRSHILIPRERGKDRDRILPTRERSGHVISTWSSVTAGMGRIHQVTREGREEWSAEI